MKKISAEKAFTEFQSNSSEVTFIDVRTRGEYDSQNVDGINCHPLNQLETESSNFDKQKRILILCQSGKRSEMAAATLEKKGFSNVEVITGGIEAWEKAGYPTVKGEGTISLERQVRIAAGALVAIGTALGFLLSPYFYIIPAFVGCGLVFAGLTDTCAMGMLIAKLPWNNCKGSCVK